MNSLKPYFDLCRVSNLPTVWTNVLAAAILSGEGFSWPPVLLLGISMSLFYSGGMCLNDLWDREVDRVKRPSRPIPAGRVTLQRASRFAALLFGIGLALLVLAPFPGSFFAGLTLLGLITAYDRIHKRVTWSVLLMAGCRLMVFVTVGLAVAGEIKGPVLIGGALQFVYIVVLSLVARYETRRPGGFSFPVIPWMLSAISLLDGLVMAAFVSSAWLVAGLAGALLTRLGQRYVRGD